MPGHVDGFTAFAAFTFGSKSPMTYTQAEWRTIEQDLTKKLRGFRLPRHETKEAMLISMLPTATAISKHALAVDRAIGLATRGRRTPARRRSSGRRPRR